ncbi:hypothetical protein [Sulfitobacter sp. S190]|uniref:hypothetical protein n=1 Tax=Sulfitobacter sp. S190 TaxID=2867022 RepID=UPI0021A2BD67|nr:hypothetical protein [Sulfitobacter sp. S190]UWR22274.1 hypothetical protein K3756_16625 [Sulfitobacter sp. S190]
MFKLHANRFTMTLVAAAIAISGFSAMPAYADDDRAARAIATILGLAVVGKIIHDKNKKDKKRDKARKQVKKNHVHKGNRHHHDGYAHSHDNGRFEHRHRTNKVEPRPIPKRVDRKLLPRKCFRSYDTRQGQYLMFGRRCLERNYRHADRLPQNCGQTLRTFDGNRRGYDARCLRRNGYSLARG